MLSDSVQEWYISVTQHIFSRLNGDLGYTFTLYTADIGFRRSAKSTNPIRNIQLSEAERNNISPLQ
jgi:hypothetical protein